MTFFFFNIQSFLRRNLKVHSLEKTQLDATPHREHKNSYIDVQIKINSIPLSGQSLKLFKVGVISELKNSLLKISKFKDIIP